MPRPSVSLRAIAVSTTKRVSSMPNVPTVAESGVPGYDLRSWYGLLAPAATPKPVITRLHAEAVKALRAPDVVEKLSGQGAEPVASTPEEFTAFIRSETDKWANLVKAANMRTD